MHKALSGAVLLTLIALPAQADQKNITYEFRLLSETERLPNGTVEVVPVTLKDIFATLVLTHDAVEDREATLVFVGSFPPSPPRTNDDKGVVSFTSNVSSQGPFGIQTGVFDYPPNARSYNINMDLEIQDGELSGSIQEI